MSDRDEQSMNQKFVCLSCGNIAYRTSAVGLGYRTTCPLNSCHDGKSVIVTAVQYAPSWHCHWGHPEGTIQRL